MRDVLRTPPLHRKFATMNGESSITILHAALKLHHDPHPWDDLWRAMAVEHPLRDEWWDERNLLPLLDRVEVPTYLGCDWQNVPLHLPSTFPAMRALTNAPVVRVGMLGEFGLTWPWESLHVEALAWFDHWLKDRDTGILDGPAIRYWMPGADEWRTSDTWPPAGVVGRPLSLRADGALGDDEGTPGQRSFMVLGAGLGRARPSETDPPALLEWTSAPLEQALDVVGDIELELHASATAIDTAWIVTLQDVAPDGTVVDVTAGWLRASLRRVDPDRSPVGSPELPCRDADAVVPGSLTAYRIPLVTNARRFAAGHRVRLVVTSDDQDPSTPAIMGFRHATGRHQQPQHHPLVVEAVPPGRRWTRRPRASGVMGPQELVQIVSPSPAWSEAVQLSVLGGTRTPNLLIRSPFSAVRHGPPRTVACGLIREFVPARPVPSARVRPSCWEICWDGGPRRRCHGDADSVGRGGALERLDPGPARVDQGRQSRQSAVKHVTDRRSFLRRIHLVDGASWVWHLTCCRIPSASGRTR